MSDGHDEFDWVIDEEDGARIQAYSGADQKPLTGIRRVEVKCSIARDPLPVESFPGLGYKTGHTERSGVIHVKDVDNQFAMALRGMFEKRDRVDRPAAYPVFTIDGTCEVPRQLPKLVTLATRKGGLVQRWMVRNRYPYLFRRRKDALRACEGSYREGMRLEGVRISMIDVDRVEFRYENELAIVMTDGAG